MTGQQPSYEWSDSMDSLAKLIEKIPNPFERRQFAFQVLPEEKDPMSRAKAYSFIMPTLKTRLQQLLTTRIWEYLMFFLSIWSFIPLLLEHQLPGLRLFFELTHEINKGLLDLSFISPVLLELLAALCIEVVCKLYIDYRWFFYDYWNLYDLACVILNSPVSTHLCLVKTSFRSLPVRLQSLSTWSSVCS